MEQLGSGYGVLWSPISNTLADTPENMLSVVFALSCTGGGAVSFTVDAGGARKQPAQAHSCDGSVAQQSIAPAKHGPVSFSAEVTGSLAGSFAYAYYVEKTQS
ncbi:hypothetical protein ACWT_8128 [Actinoplanes sp. SE50]|uniref:hypothetical protein n=1 Tax=unclassified Actinoplanes TaxID=2626549 RepID=UPI00023EDD47|nr:MULTISPECIES: hypothetical protein [unclassified Actinoplanes]AEV89137.1 hypothetical protein ACPL_8259 [Actinoplanes sp. SE50/110]ATO87543.1 hypothetical protein ACWT_8128 [Actinoplanes sp. SE50]SLM04961.1 hypothetical protein ACSP50_8276 [Actinoplanes sp. SE50/110]